MAPIPNQQQQQQMHPAQVRQQFLQGLALFNDYHYSEPSEADAQQPGILGMFECICVLTRQGQTLQTISKLVGENGGFGGFLNSSIPLPEDFQGLWCRIFYRQQRTFILVMDVNRQDFIVYDLETGHDEGRWTLHEPLPEGAWLSSVETLVDELMFSLNYTVGDNVHSADCWFNAHVEEGYAA